MYNQSNQDNINLLNEFYRYISFWPLFLVSFIFFISIAYTYLRYTEYNYEIFSRIEIVDKAQDSEMALPTSMTVFNRSMINLENETGIINSYSLHSRVVKNLKSNVKYFNIGSFKDTESYSQSWFDDYEMTFNISLDTLENRYDFLFSNKNNKLNISVIKGEEVDKTYSFENFSTYGYNHNLPFEFKLNSKENFSDKKMTILPFENIVEFYRKNVVVEPEGKTSDQLNLTLLYPNDKIAIQYINTLMSEFDKDGILDRQLEYKRTMDFVDSRSVILSSELERIEFKKLEFKKKNKLTNIEFDATNSLKEKFVYNSELFDTQSQKDLSLFLKESIQDSIYKYLPLNIGLESNIINQSIIEFNALIKERDLYLISVGPKNALIKNLENQLDNYRKNILTSIDNYINNLEISISNIRKKEDEFSSVYNTIPENEKILRSIERELEVKESLFLLLLQKREEAAINFAVVKPSIKIIDPARSSLSPVSPKPIFVYLLSILVSLLIPFSVLFIWFLLDNKIHTRTQLKKLISDIPIIGEVPFITSDNDLNNLINIDSRTPLAESIRMIIANLNYIFAVSSKEKKCIKILVTSSIKSEGKTIISANLAKLLAANDKKVLLIGADLRNPQLHKLISKSKSLKGLSDMMYNSDVNEYKKYLLNIDGIDIMLSGTIPPNPTELLASNIFEDFLKSIDDDYDYIVIDSAPCLLVSDTFEIANKVDLSLYVIRANHAEITLTDFINECNNTNKLRNMNIVFNSVGNSKSYGYKYGYQYGYKYSYKYSYNYGYGYGYSEDKE